MYFLHLPIPLRSKKLMLSRSNSPVLLFSKWGVKTEPDAVERKTKMTIQATFCYIIPQYCRPKNIAPCQQTFMPLSYPKYTAQECMNIFKLTCTFNEQLSFLTGLIINKYRIKNKVENDQRTTTDAHDTFSAAVKIFNTTVTNKPS